MYFRIMMAGKGPAKKPEKTFFTKGDLYNEGNKVKVTSNSLY